MHTSKHRRSSRLQTLIDRVPERLRTPLLLGVATIVGIGLIASPGLLAIGAANEPASISTASLNVVRRAMPELVPTAPQKEHRSDVVGFYVNWDDTSYRSLARNIDKMTMLMPEWYHLNNAGHVFVDDPKQQARAMKLVRSRGKHLKVMPIVNNFDAPAVQRFLHSPKARRTMASQIVRTMRANHFDGVNIDFEGLPASSRHDLVAFMRVLAPLAHRNGLVVSQDVIVGSPTYDHRNLARAADFLVPMMYDEHWKTSGPGPIASQRWFKGALKKFLGQVPPNKVVLALGTYGYDWSLRGGRASSLTYAQARAIVRKHKTPLKLDPGSLNATLKYGYGARARRAWVLDSVSTFNQVKTGTRHGVRGFAIWRLGAEDPAMWQVMSNRDDLNRETALSLRGPHRALSYDETSGLITREYVKP